MIHKHNFVVAKDDIIYPNGALRRPIEGKRYVCINLGCGETRDVYETGTVTQVRPGLSEEDEPTALP